jgi:solute carrier family 25 S-adenosylmethionine transporter 26
VSYAEFRGKIINPLESAACGSIAGGIAAAVTTPLDVMKTRLMLKSVRPFNIHCNIRLVIAVSCQDKDGIPYKGISDTFSRLLVEGRTSPKGVMGTFFAGIQPRVMWISIGGFVFFGAYEQARMVLSAF